MRRKTKKRGLARYTAVVPKTFKATKNLSKRTIKSINSIFIGAKSIVKNTAKYLDKKTAKAISSITAKRNRK
jgi:hypothetical protein